MEVGAEAGEVRVVEAPSVHERQPKESSSDPPLPNFRLDGDSRISVPLAVRMDEKPEVLAALANRSLEGSGPVSGQSEEMRLSLVSWCSEPDRPGGCCRSSPPIPSDKSSDEKENKTPRRVVLAARPECPRCTRRSKSGSTTPAVPSRTPRRTLQVKSASDEKKPIKSILKGPEKSLESLTPPRGEEKCSRVRKKDPEQEVMSKSMSYLEDRAPLRRQGSVKKPAWEPCGTRTSALRLAKMQEKKGSQSGGSTHSGSGDSLHASPGGKKERGRVFVKLASSVGQTASSNGKRLRQERAIQTEDERLSPEPSNPDIPPEADESKKWERLAQQYRQSALRFQKELEKSEEKTKRYKKLLTETQADAAETIDFLSAEKSTLADALAEAENDGKKMSEELKEIEKSSQGRCSSLVRLSEQHKQESLKSQALFNRLQAQSRNAIDAQTAQISNSASNIRLITQQILSLTDSISKAQKEPQEGDDLGWLLFPLFSSMTDLFPVSMEESMVSSIPAPQPLVFPEKSPNKKSGSLQDLNQAILDREAAERNEGINEIEIPISLSLSKAVDDLNQALTCLFSAIKTIVSHRDKRVSSVALNILQCLKSVEDDKKGNNPELANMEKSLAAWTEPPSPTSPNSQNGHFNGRSHTTHF